MGGWSEQRLEPRVDYRAPVRVMPAGESRHVLGQSLNLSPLGMLVDAPQPYPVGTQISCDITLPGGSKALRGRIVRVQPLSPSSTGLAIGFVDLSPSDLSALRTLVHGENHDPDELAVRVNGSNWLLRGRAELEDDGYHVTLPLPFLAADAPIDLASSPSAPVITRALVRDVALLPAGPDGIPRLRIGVRLAGGGASDEPTPEAATPVAAEVEFDSHPDTPPPQVLIAEEIGPDHTEVTGPRRTAAAVATDRRARRALTLVAALLLGTAAGLVFKYAPGLRERSWRSLSSAAAPTVTPTPAAIEPAPVATTAALESVAAAPSALPARAPATGPEIVPVTPDPAGDKPQFHMTAKGAQAVVFLRGSLANERHYALTSPAGMAVNLPGARPVPPFGRYRADSRAFREIWIQPLRDGGAHLRFIFRGPYGKDPVLDLSPGLVSVTVARPPATDAAEP